MNASFLVGLEPTGIFNSSVANQEKRLQILRWGYSSTSNAGRARKEGFIGKSFFKQVSTAVLARI